MIALAMGGLAGCGGATSADSEKIAELEERVEAAESEAAAAEAEAESAADTENDVAVQEVVEEEPAEEEPADGGDCIKVPNVVGKDHQLAQDTMQAAGLYYLDERDATGQGRMLMLDRNWTTVKQRPKAGKCVPEDTEIMLSAVKDDER